VSEEFERYFTLGEAEQTRREIEPLLIEAMEGRRKVGELQERLGALAARIMMTGGLLVSVEQTARVRGEHDHLMQQVKSALEQIQATGCVVKDLDVGLLDFPARLNNQDVFLCWRLGEDRIRFYHGLEEGFAGRKPLDPRDPGTTIQ
jgi:hypothetical protein